jgi:hypothetical protein
VPEAVAASLEGIGGQRGAQRASGGTFYIGSGAYEQNRDAGQGRTSEVAARRRSRAGMAGFAVALALAGGALAGAGVYGYRQSPQVQHWMDSIGRDFAAPGEEADAPQSTAAVEPAVTRTPAVIPVAPSETRAVQTAGPSPSDTTPAPPPAASPAAATKAYGPSPRNAKGQGAARASPARSHTPNAHGATRTGSKKGGNPSRPPRDDGSYAAGAYGPDCRVFPQARECQWLR